MGFFNIIITMGVGLVMLFGAALTYKHRMAERQWKSIRWRASSSRLQKTQGPPRCQSGTTKTTRG